MSTPVPSRVPAGADSESRSRADWQLRGAAARGSGIIARRFGNRLGLWLVSEYPKSGGTWLGRMLADYLRLPFPQQSRLPIAMPAVMHNHWCYDNRFPHGFYIYRDGRDVMVSLYFHTLSRVGRNGSSAERSLSGDIVKDLPEFLEREFTKPLATKVGWPEHVEQWLGHEQIYTVSYEQLLTDAVQAIAGGLSHFGASLDPQRLQETVARESFERVTGRKPGQVQHGAFMRKGIVGDWRTHFSRDAAQVFEAHGGGCLRALGYEAGSTWVAQCPTASDLLSRDRTAG